MSKRTDSASRLIHASSEADAGIPPIIVKPPSHGGLITAITAALLLTACSEAFLTAEEEELLKLYRIRGGSSGCSWLVTGIERIWAPKGEFLIGEQEFHDQVRLQLKGEKVAIVRLPTANRQDDRYRQLQLYPARDGIRGWLGKGSISCRNWQHFSYVLMVEDIGKALE